MSAPAIALVRSIVPIAHSHDRLPLASLTAGVRIAPTRGVSTKSTSSGGHEVNSLGLPQLIGFDGAALPPYPDHE